jgi:hypothetical protein
MSSLVLESNIIVTVAIAAILCSVPGLWFSKTGRLRPLVTSAAWIVAYGAIALNSLARPIYDDEVFYLAQAFEAHRGTTSAYLPMRIWPYYPFLALHLSPGGTIIASRVAMIFAAILCGLMVRAIALKINPSRSIASVIGALAALSFGNLPMGTMVPEFIAFLFLLTGIWALLAPPGRWSRELSLFLCGFMLASACATSLRLVLFGPAVLIAVFLEPEARLRIRSLIWTTAGMLAGALPSLFHILLKDSVSAVFYWHYTFIRKIDFIHITEPVTLPAIVAAAAALGCWFLWKSRNLYYGSMKLLVLWCAAMISAILNPQKMEHTLGPWLALSFIAAAAALGNWAVQTGLAGKRLALLIVFLLFITQAIPNLEMLQDPSSVSADLANAGSGLRLINWLAEIADGEPVICVPPFHPIFAPNAWEMWNVIYYCYIRDAEVNFMLEPRLKATLMSRKAAVLGWDPWPKEAGAPNILAYLVQRKFISAEEAPRLAEDLCRSYRLVKWPGPLTDEFGGGRFLVRRDIKLDGRVRMLDDSLIVHASLESSDQ